MLRSSGWDRRVAFSEQYQFRVALGDLKISAAKWVQNHVLEHVQRVDSGGIGRGTGKTPTWPSGLLTSGHRRTEIFGRTNAIQQSTIPGYGTLIAPCQGLNRFVPQVTTLLCFTWLGLFVLWGGSEAGWDWYLNWLAPVVLSADNPKAAVPILVLALPVIVAGTVSSLCLVQKRPSCGVADSHVSAICLIPRQSSTCRRNGILQKLARLFAAAQEPMNLFLTFVFTPVCGFVALVIQREMAREPPDTDKPIVQAAFAVGALVVMNLLFIPVALHSPLLQLIDWSKAHAIVFHRWIGNLVVVFAVLIHGGMHSYRWFVKQRGDLLHIPAECWRDWGANEPKGCHHKKDCPCRLYLMNLTGYLCGIALLVLAMSSLEPIRRRFYHIFLRIHTILGPLCLVLIIAHWTKAILYLSGGILYYLACSIPSFVESRIMKRAVGVPIVSAELIPDDVGSQKGPFVSLTVEVSPQAMKRYQSGQYIRLRAPEIAGEAHPFTINQVVTLNKNEKPCMRIIFRQMGRFTTKLGQRLMDSNAVPPLIQMDGFHGKSNQLEQMLRHDVVLIVAGGIGITPYLSLLHHLHRLYSISRCDEMQRLHVHVHWSCRDQSLIDYVNREHLGAIVQVNGELEVRCTIHYTSKRDETGQDETSALISQKRGHLLEFENRVSATPFQPSMFAVGSHASHLENIPTVTSFVLIGGLGLVIVWLCFCNWRMGYLVSLLPLGILCGSVALLVNTINPGMVAATTVDNLVPPGKKSPERADSESSSLLGTDVSETDSERSAPSVLRTHSVIPDEEMPLLQVEGRPNFSIISSYTLEDAAAPAVFVCGPAGLVENLRKAVKGRHVEIYEETFEM